MIFAIGLIFELPIFIIGLVRLGIVSSDTLRQNRRIGYGIVHVIGVLLPGIDFVSMTVETLPLLGLFEVSIWAAVIAERRMAARDLAPGPDLAALQAARGARPPRSVGTPPPNQGEASSRGRRCRFTLGREEFAVSRRRSRRKAVPWTAVSKRALPRSVGNASPESGGSLKPRAPAADSHPDVSPSRLRLCARPSAGQALPMVIGMMLVFSIASPR